MAMMSYQNKKVKQWSNSDLLEWVKSIGLSEKWQSTLVTAITESECTGEDFASLESGKELGECFDIRIPMLYNRVFKEMRKIQRKQQYMDAVEYKVEMQETFSVNIYSMNKTMTIKNLKPSHTVAELKQFYCDQGMGQNKNFVVIFKGKTLRDNLTLKDCGIRQGSMLNIAFKLIGGGSFESYHDEWTIMYERCPVCLHKNFGNKDKLTKYYWYHGSRSAEYKTSKSDAGSCVVEIKGNKIRCHGSKCDEADAKDWTYKCPNHGHEKIQ